MTLSRNQIYLASRSPRRRELLRQIGVNYGALLLRESLSRAPDVDETPLPDEVPADYACRIARLKAETGWKRLIQRRLPLLPVLAADTVVSLEERIFGKPRDSGHAEEILAALSGRTHRVLTAVAVTAQGRMRTSLSTTTVRFRELSLREIRAYLASGEAQDKAGAYAIQGTAAVFIEEIVGSYSGVVGLPLFETAQLLKKFEIDIFSETAAAPSGSNESLS